MDGGVDLGCVDKSGVWMGEWIGGVCRGGDVEEWKDVARGIRGGERYRQRARKTGQRRIDRIREIRATNQRLDEYRLEEKNTSQDEGGGGWALRGVG